MFLLYSSYCVHPFHLIPFYSLVPFYQKPPTTLLIVSGALYRVPSHFILLSMLYTEHFHGKKRGITTMIKSMSVWLCANFSVL